MLGHELYNTLSLIKEQILLGQVAHTFATLVEDFVFDGIPTEQLQTLALQQYHDFGFTTEQQRRWEQVQDFGADHVGDGQLIKIDKMLRKGPSFLPREDDMKKADLAAMESWAAHYYQRPCAIHAVRRYLFMLSQFSDSGHPLVPPKTMADVLLQQKLLNEHGLRC